MQALKLVQIEDAITAKMRQRHSNLLRVIIHRNHRGWECHRVRLLKESPMPSDREMLAIRAEANGVLTEMIDEMLREQVCAGSSDSPLNEIAKG
jgi:hypothetical protein